PAVLEPVRLGHAGSWIEGAPCHAPRARIDPRDAPADRGDPEPSPAVEVERVDVVMRDGGGIGGACTQPIERARVRIEAVQPFLSADPEKPVLVFDDRVDAVVAQTPGIRRIVPQDLEAPGGAIEEREASRVRSNPEMSRLVFVNDADRVVGKGMRVADLVLVDADRVAVPDGQSLARAYPEKARSVAEEGWDRLRGNPALLAEPLKDEILGERRRGHGDGEDGDRGRDDGSRQFRAGQVHGALRRKIRPNVAIF